MRMTLIPAALLAVFCLTNCGGSAKTEPVNSNSEATGRTAMSVQPVKTVEPTGKAEPIHLTKAEFPKKVYDFENSPNAWVYAGDKPCIIDFYADWCRPCKMVAPILAELAEKYSDQIRIYKINTDDERELAQFFGIRSIPTILFCPMKGQPQMTQGALPKETFEKAVNEVLLGKKAGQ